MFKKIIEGLEFSKVKLLRLFIISIIIIPLDQITKKIITLNVKLYTSIEVIPGFFDITHLLNKGGFFGFLSDQSIVIRIAVFLIFSGLATVLVLYYYFKIPYKIKTLSFATALIFAGAIGNLIDRVLFQQVVDFLDVYVMGWHWPAFNVADMAISIGVTLFIYNMIFLKDEF